MVTVKIDLFEIEYDAVMNYSKKHSININKAINTAINNMLEDEFDSLQFNEAYKEYKKNPKTYSLEETIKIINKKRPKGLFFFC